MEKDQREALLEAGVRVVHARGLAATGVRDIAIAARVPQGSFTNHFRSKEAFGLLVLDRYAERIDAIMRETLGDEARAPAERLRAYSIGSRNQRLRPSGGVDAWFPILRARSPFTMTLCGRGCARCLPGNRRSSRGSFAWLGLTTKTRRRISAPFCLRPGTARCSG
jgi:AcrR family transcriptional regulator